ncbi:hypothetical protein DFH06DRAFT_1284258 [Mycena polygramma]|nr:hypothetical protein DFH06DRAFT_1284258 [Mycena polygramma]
MTPKTALLAFMGLAFTNACASARTVYNLPSAVSNGTSQADFTSSSAGLNAPKIHPVNGSAYDLWYFDVVSTDPTSHASVVVVFFDTAPEAFPFVGSSNTTLLVSLAVSFPNGTLSSIGVTSVPSDSATVTEEGNGSDGTWHGSGFSWKYDVVSGAYDIFIDSPSLDRGQPRYPCGPAVAGENMEIVPNAGYSNGLPDAVSTVDLLVGGTRLAFVGAGYQDQGWGPQPFAASVGSWYWGHGRVGPYSVVWFDILAVNGMEYVSAYAAKDEIVLVNSCYLGSIRVRPTGENATYPPHSGTEKPSAYRITMDLGAEGVLDMNVSVVAPLISVPVYARSVGHITGSITPAGESGATMSGIALLEEFALEP